MRFSSPERVGSVAYVFGKQDAVGINGFDDREDK
jgi:hypothetical protein